LPWFARELFQRVEHRFQIGPRIESLGVNLMPVLGELALGANFTSSYSDGQSGRAAE